MSDGVLIAIISSSGALVLAIWNTVSEMLRRRHEKKNGVQEQLDRMEKMLVGQDARMDKLEKHNDLQYLSLLRLTVMDSDMPMSERLMAGQEYLDRGGNGDVKHFFESLKAKVDTK